MAGTVINVGAILLGGILGLSLRRDLSPKHQLFLKTLLGVLALYTGFRMVWISVHGSLFQVLLQIFVALVALVLGNLMGRGLGFQNQVNGLGRYARERLAKAKSGASQDFSEGFVTCSILFCVGPLAIVGSIQDGLHNDPRPLLVKAAMDGLATFAFVRIFGIGTLFSAFPVLAYQGTLSLLARYLKPVMAHPAMLDGFSTTGGFMVAATALLILDVRKVPLADYLPALILAPLLRLLIS
ncbi:MAG: DUF554 domain-containing protein [Verrucomicrobiales bacterium]|nr:DUF554 domain-containing protein [Verrucomicrobiales bacterium]